MKHLSRAVFIDCCKDKTLTWRRRGQRPFNGVAIPVFTVDTPEEAEQLIIALGRVQYGEHPKLPGRVWRKCTLDGELDFKPHLELGDLDAVTAKIERTYGDMRGRQK